MVVVTQQSMTLEEYLRYDAGADTRYELVDGVLRDMGAESTVNIEMAMFLIVLFARFMPIRFIHRGTEIEVVGDRANTRFPDLMVLTEDCAAALAGKRRSLITLDMPNPALVIEMVSSSDTDPGSRDRDYIQKRQEYAQRGIPEYWIVDAIAAQVLVLQWQDGVYRERRFRGDERLVSAVLPEMGLTASQVLQSGR